MSLVLRSPVVVRRTELDNGRASMSPELGVGVSGYWRGTVLTWGWVEDRAEVAEVAWTARSAGGPALVGTEN